MTEILQDALRGSSGSADSVQLHPTNQSVTFPGDVNFTTGKTVTIPSGATIANSGTATGFGGGKLVGVKWGTIGTFNEDLGGTGYSNEKEFSTVTYTPVSNSNTIIHYSIINIDARAASYSNRIYMYGRVDNSGAGSSSGAQAANWLVHGETDGAVWNLPFMWKATGWSAGTASTFKLYGHSEGTSGSGTANQIRVHGTGYYILAELELS